MSDQRQFGWKSGRLISRPLARFWQSPATLDAADPEIPSLPLLTAAAAAGILALAFGYFEPAPAADLDSYVGTVIEAPSAPATYEAEVYYVLGEAIEAEDAEESAYQPLPVHELQGTVVDAIPVITEAEPDEGLPESFLAPLLVAEEVAAVDYIAQVWTNPEAGPPQDAYASMLAHLTPPAEPASDLISAVLTDPLDPEETPESLVSYQFEDDAFALTTFIPDEEEAEESPESFLGLVFSAAEAADLTQIPPPVLTDPEDGPDLEDAYYGLLFDEPPAADVLLSLDFGDVDDPAEVEDSFIPISVFDPPQPSDVVAEIDFGDVDEAEPVADSFVGATFENPTIEPLGPELTVATLTDLPPDEPVAVYSYGLITVEASAELDLTQIPAPVITDLGETPDLEDSILGLIFEDDALPLLADMPEWDDGEPVEESLLSLVFEEAPPPDLTFVPGWQDDYLRAYEQQREDEAEAALVGMVFDPYGQVDDPPPYVPPESCFIPPFRRRRR